LAEEGAGRGLRLPQYRPASSGAVFRVPVHDTYPSLQNAYIARIRSSGCVL